MKKIIGVAFCVLLTGSGLLFSCSKPDASQTPTPGNPTVPSGPVVPPVLLTEAQIIQKAIEKLENNTFDISSCLRSLRGKLKPSSVEYSFYEDFPGGPLRLYPDILYPTTTFLKGALIAGTPYKYEKNKMFYDKIFVNEVGDSFLGGLFSSGGANLVTNPSDMLSVDTIKATHFQNLPKLFSFKTDSISFVKRLTKRLLIGNPSQIHYYFNKDSLVFSYVSDRSFVFVGEGDTIATQHDYVNFQVIEAILRK